VNQTITPCGGGGDVIDEFDVGAATLGPGLVSITINVTSNGVPYSLLFTTDLLTAPNATGTADTQVATGGPLVLQDTNLVDDARAYWIRTNDGP
jgi:hypothetical protein